ncbi:Hvo_1808 family surface protein [Candidatus Halobonum tyrrellensis]|uniref:Lipoprotein n=1 Tax=Candidatus Halobonum tyrrellensis G22 TaxID=1324957 RepID=V4HA02_9EURY|nr:Hvo_1808 family surface protein [Candidatus Halobonum tyrrellensis]ESP87540.1 lipoprotein [Candidatus Halobonum tyrrellensis G22]
MRHAAAAVAAALLFVLAGCAAPAAQPSLRDGWQWPEDPATDRIGFEDGVWYNESIDVDQSDGLTARERRLFVARTMARVERIRGLEFDRRVPVEVIGREEYRTRSVFTGGRSGAYHAWHNQVWEAALVVGEGENVSGAFDALYGGSVAGYYTPANDRIVVVSDSARPSMDRGTLAHELVHALQDQRFGIAGAGSRDAALAHDGLTEGDARYVETLYEQRCEANWSCIATPASADADNSNGSDGSTASVDRGLFTYIYQPYADGPGFVHRLRERGGWAAVNEAYADPPASTEQTIHPERYPEEGVAAVSVADRSAAGWSRFDLPRTTERLGETGVYAMFRAQATINRSHLRTDDVAYSPYNYSHPLSTGWAGDRLVPYRSGTGESAEYGYVWALRWDTAADATEFADGYRATLRSLGAERVRAGVFEVPDGPFADAFRVERRGRTVVITNAPTAGQLDAVHAPAS